VFTNAISSYAPHGRREQSTGLRVIRWVIGTRQDVQVPESERGSENARLTRNPDSIPLNLGRLLDTAKDGYSILVNSATVADQELVRDYEEVSSVALLSVCVYLGNDLIIFPSLTPVS